MKKLLILAIVLFSFSASAYAVNDSTIVKCWIVFSDKGKFKPDEKITYNSEAYRSGYELLTERAVNRRLKVMSKEELISFRDLPVEDSYIEKISQLGINIIAKSRWFNGVSAYLTKNQIEKLAAQDYVRQIFAVKKLYKQNFDYISPVFIRDYYGNDISADTANVYDYGKSLPQMSLIDAVKVHNLGITGKGVLVASFDDGFEWKNHDAFSKLQVLDEFDFINGDKVVFREQNQKHEDTPSQGAHGTATLSSLAGFSEGKLIGPAFNSEFILAKTEYVASETPMEEDFWLEAAEWAEAYGADVITSSLVYKTYDDPYKENSYKYTDFDGNTAIISVAGDIAAGYGMVVCNAIGNYYQTDPPSLGSAADGDSVISVGAVDMKGNITGFSSNGPASDGKIKPDIVSPGAMVYVARMGDGSKYEFSNGTSFSTPITAGVCALILSAHPELTPMQVRDALRNTANNTANPNNVYGWGLINAYKAILFFGPVWSEPEILKSDKGIKVRIGFASNDFKTAIPIKFEYRTKNTKKFKSKDMELVRQIESGNYSGVHEIALDGISDLSEVETNFTVTIGNNKYSYNRK
jgi:serine protease AprX